MNDAGKVVRKGFYDALNSQLEHPDNGATTIPVVDEKLDVNITEHDLYVLIGGQAASPADNKSHWVREVDLNITIVNRRKATNSKVIIENISDQMLEIIFPTRTTFGISIEQPFLLSYVKYQSENYVFDQTPDGWEIKKSIVLRTRITQI